MPATYNKLSGSYFFLIFFNPVLCSVFISGPGCGIQVPIRVTKDPSKVLDEANGGDQGCIRVEAKGAAKLLEDSKKSEQKEIEK